MKLLTPIATPEGGRSPSLQRNRPVVHRGNLRRQNRVEFADPPETEVKLIDPFPVTAEVNSNKPLPGSDSQQTPSGGGVISPTKDKKKFSLFPRLFRSFSRGNQKEET